MAAHLRLVRDVAPRLALAVATGVVGRAVVDVRLRVVGDAPSGPSSHVEGSRCVAIF